MSRAITIVIVAALLGWAILLRPAGLVGGTTGYVVVHGTSMLPTLHNGDLVVSRGQAHYTVGEVVAYHVPNGEFGQGRLVIHRVVAISSSGALTLRGDNNPTVDPWHPRSANVIGSQWLHLPKAGGMLLALRTPPMAAAIAALLAVWLVYRRERVLDRLERMYPAAWEEPGEERSRPELLGRTRRVAVSVAAARPPSR